MENNIPTNEKVMGVVVTDSKAKGYLTYDAVRTAWQLTDSQLSKADQARYVLAIEHGTVIDIFEKHGNFVNVSDDNRYAFFPVPVTDRHVRSLYIGKYHHARGAAVVFIGFDEKI